jgi:putative PEP-CTERM system TPR-repeat lipoprotein
MNRYLLLAVLLGTAACGTSGGSPAEMIARGEQALKEGQPRTARIEFLNAIKADPDNSRLRLLQAQTYLDLGDGVAAEAEIRRARQLRVSEAETKHLMAHALMLQGKFEAAITEAANVPAQHAAYAARIRGQAQADSGDIAGAADSFDEAVKLKPEDPAIWTDIARFRRSIGNTAGALEAADRAVKLKPNDLEAITLRGELTRSQYGLAAALPWFDRALELDEDNLSARLEKAATLGDMGRMKEMLAETRRVLEIAPNQPMAYYLQAMLAARARKFDLARSLYQKTGGALDTQPAGMLLASAIEFQTGAVEQAVTRLERLVALQPENRKARRLLAAAHWQRGNVGATIATLQPVADRPDADSYSLALLGKAYEKQGDADAASRYLARASQPQRPAPAALLAPAMTEAQVNALRKLAETKPDEVQAQVLLIGALLSRGESGEALDRARRLQAKHPGAADAHLLVGDALSVQGQLRGRGGRVSQGREPHLYRAGRDAAHPVPAALRPGPGRGQGPAALPGAEPAQRAGHADGSQRLHGNGQLGQGDPNLRRHSQPARRPRRRPAQQSRLCLWRAGAI